MSVLVVAGLQRQSAKSRRMAGHTFDADVWLPASAEPSPTVVDLDTVSHHKVPYTNRMCAAMFTLSIFDLFAFIRESTDGSLHWIATPCYTFDKSIRCRNMMLVNSAHVRCLSL